MIVSLLIPYCSSYCNEICKNSILRYDSRTLRNILARGKYKRTVVEKEYSIVFVIIREMFDIKEKVSGNGILHDVLVYTIIKTSEHSDDDKTGNVVI